MDYYLKTIDIKWFRQRLIFVIFVVMAAFSLLIGRLLYLQVIEGDEYRRLSKFNCIRLQYISPPRGLIYDRHGKLLVDNRPSFNLGIVLKDARPLKSTLRKLAGYMGLPEKEIFAKIKKNKGTPSYKPIWIKRDIDRNMLAVLKAHKFDLPGVVVDIRPKRQYMYGIAAHLIGYMSQISPEELKSGIYPKVRGGDFIGKVGIEKEAEAYLRGKPGGRQVEVNAKGQVVRVLKTVDPVPGNNIYLTIDFCLQKKAEQLMENFVGAVIAIDPGSGNILAMHSSPSFDPNAFIRGMNSKEWQTLINNPFFPLQNKVIRGKYPPASTYKIVTAMAALEEGAIDENAKLYCPGYYKLGNRTFRCWRKWGHGYVDMRQALAASCDVYFYQAGLRLGVDRLAWYAHKCGLGDLTGIRLGNEEKGLIPTSEWKKKRFGVSWQKGETLSIAIGQGYNLVTPLQMGVLISAVANGGILYRPRIIDKIVSPKGNIIMADPKEITGRLPASEKTLSIIREGLWNVVNGPKGTAKIARVEGIVIRGKTGTAQVVSRKKNDSRNIEYEDHLKPHAWFIAYGEKENRQIAVAVIVEHGEHGSGTAAPIARDLIKAYFYGAKNVKPDEPE